ncbi:hypothetical protein ACWKWN_06085 [Microbacterium trichothecenolyticum]
MSGTIVVVATELTKARQRHAVGEGLALGAVMAGIPSVHGNAIALQFAFRRAWRAWDYADRFPAIKAGPAQDDIFHILDGEVRRRASTPTGWVSSWPYLPTADGNDWDDIADIIDYEVPASAWRDLAVAWVGEPAS